LELQQVYQTEVKPFVFAYRLTADARLGEAYGLNPQETSRLPGFAPIRFKPLAFAPPYDP